MGGTPDERRLRWLARLVTVLTAVMIAGVVAIVALLVTRLGQAPVIPLPETIALPKGETALSVTVGPDWYAVGTARGRFLVYDRGTGALLRDVEVRN
jgi:Family of unknown function (DUF6476)